MSSLVPEGTRDEAPPNLQTTPSASLRDTISRMSKLTLSLLAAFGLVSFATAQPSSPKDIPSTLQVPPGVHLVLETHATGTQNYNCTKNPEGKYSWTLKGPDAELRDDAGHMVIQHSAGPTWQHKDGSRVTGKVLAKADAPDASSIPWLLLQADNSGSSTGVLSTVTYIQRIHTQGGQPSGPCGADMVGNLTRSNYSADYLFYAPAR